MESWNVVDCNDPEGDYVLLNKSRTIVRFSKRFPDVDILGLMSKMEESNVPFSYTEELKEIYFTLLPGKTHGDYINGRIRLSCGHASSDIQPVTLVHELAHHIDELEDISGRESVAIEKKNKANMLQDKYAQKNISEYVAIGFEVYYFGDKKARAEMKKNNPKLWNTIKNLHSKYRSR